MTVDFRNAPSERVFVEDPVGTAENVMSESRHDAKFTELTSGVLGIDRAQALLAKLKNLDSGMSVAKLTAICEA